MKSIEYSEILIKNGKKICTSKDIAKIFGESHASTLSKIPAISSEKIPETPRENYISIISKLINGRWIMRIRGFKGLYYVLDPVERQTGVHKLIGFQILIRALNTLFEKEWYFGRITAAGLAGRIHQPVSTYFVINKKQNKKIDSKLFGKLVLIKMSTSIEKSSGLDLQRYRDESYYVSSIERNLTDYIYLYVHGHADMDQVKNFYSNLRNSYQGTINREELISLIFRCYPKNSAIKMVGVFKTVNK